MLLSKEEKDDFLKRLQALHMTTHTVFYDDLFENIGQEQFIDNVSMEECYRKLCNGEYDAYIEKRKQRQSFYYSEEWKKLKTIAFNIYGFKCMLCGSEDDPAIDHIRSRKEHPDLELSIDNVQILCRECNRIKSNKHSKDYRSKEAKNNLAEYLRNQNS